MMGQTKLSLPEWRVMDKSKLFTFRVTHIICHKCRRGNQKVTYYGVTRISGFIGRVYVVSNDMDLTHRPKCCIPGYVSINYPDLIMDVLNVPED